MAASVVYSTFGGRVLAENRGGVIRQYLPDPLGNTAALADTTGAITDTYTYWPYGEVRTHIGTSTSPLTFLGTLGYFVDFVKQLYVRSRHLRVDLTQWITLDNLWPIELPFAYCSAMPQSLTDYSGRSATEVCQLWPCMWPLITSSHRISPRKACLKCAPPKTANQICKKFPDDILTPIEIIQLQWMLEKCPACVTPIDTDQGSECCQNFQLGLGNTNPFSDAGTCSCQLACEKEIGSPAGCCGMSPGQILRGLKACLGESMPKKEDVLLAALQAAAEL